MHVIAGKAICFLEALKPEFKLYQAQVVRNARALAEAIQWYADNRVEQQGVLCKNREMIETKISFEKNMQTISERYHALIDKHDLCAE